MLPGMEPQSWHRDGGYLVSTDPALLQVDAINAAMGSDQLWWARSLPCDALQTALRNSLCFGLYELPPQPSAEHQQDGASTQQPPGDSDSHERRPRQIGLARLVTDGVTLAYMTDMYVLEGRRGAGLGSWVMACVRETVVDRWPHLRALTLLSSSGATADFYRRTLGARDLREIEPGGAGGPLAFCIAKGPASAH